MLLVIKIGKFADVLNGWSLIQIILDLKIWKFEKLTTALIPIPGVYVQYVYIDFKCST